MIAIEGVTLTVYTPLLYSLIGLNLKLSQRAPEGPPKVVGSGAQFCCLGNDFQGIVRPLFDSFRSSPIGLYSKGVTPSKDGGISEYG